MATLALYRYVKKAESTPQMPTEVKLRKISNLFNRHVANKAPAPYILPNTTAFFGRP